MLGAMLPFATIIGVLDLLGQRQQRRHKDVGHHHSVQNRLLSADL